MSADLKLQNMLRVLGMIGKISGLVFLASTTIACTSVISESTGLPGSTESVSVEATSNLEPKMKAILDSAKVMYENNDIINEAIQMRSIKNELDVPVAIIYATVEDGQIVTKKIVLKGANKEGYDTKEVMILGGSELAYASDGNDWKVVDSPPYNPADLKGMFIRRDSSYPGASVIAQFN